MSEPGPLGLRLRFADVGSGPTVCRGTQGPGYYVSKRIIDRGPEADDPYASWRIRAGHLDTIVENQILQILRDGNQLTEWFGGAVNGEHVARLATQALARST